MGNTSETSSTFCDICRAGPFIIQIVAATLLLPNLRHAYTNGYTCVGIEAISHGTII